jgi:hypothetical protein
MAPMAWLFDRLASSWCERQVPEEGLFHGLRTYAVDSVVWSVPDTPANCQQFGRGLNSTANAAWPQMRAICLMDTYSHLIRAAEFGDYPTGVLSFAKPLMQSLLEQSSPVFDRTYFSAAFLINWQQAG